MAKSKCFFIGGELNGRIIEVDKTALTYYINIKWNREVKERIGYNRFIFDASGINRFNQNLLSVFIPESWSKKQLYEALLTKYFKQDLTEFFK